jgi:Tol biopolymer transport system component
LSGWARLVGGIFVLVAVGIAGSFALGRARPLHALVFDYFTGQDVGIYVYDIPLNVHAPYLNAPDGWESHPQWSPDGKEMLFFSSLHPVQLSLWTRDGGRRVLYSERNGEFGTSRSVFWARDGGSAFWLRGDGLVTRLDLTTRQVERHNIRNLTYVSEQDFVPMGDASALVIAMAPGDEIPRPYRYRYNADEVEGYTNPALTCERGEPHEIVPSPSGDRFALSCFFETNLYIIDAATGETEVLLTKDALPGSVRSDLRWSADGRHLIFRYVPTNVMSARMMVVDTYTGRYHPTLYPFSPLTVEWLPPEVFRAG